MELQLPDKYTRLTYSYLALRKAVGWIGILLPFVLLLGNTLIFGVSWLTKGGTLYPDKEDL